MNSDFDEIQGNTEEAAGTSGDGQRRRGRKAAQTPSRSAGKVKQMVDRFNQDEIDEDEGWGEASDA